MCWSLIGVNMSTSDKIESAYAEGYDDAYTRGEYLNPFNEEFDTGVWEAYENGYHDGMTKLTDEGIV